MNGNEQSNTIKNNSYLNWHEAFEYMHGLDDQVAKNLIGLVYGAIIQRDCQGDKPAAPFDLLFCFQSLAQAFDSYAELVIAIKGEDPRESQNPFSWE